MTLSALKELLAKAYPVRTGECAVALFAAAPALIACAEAAQFVVENLPGALSNHIGYTSYEYADMAREKADRELAPLRAALRALEDA